MGKSLHVDQGGEVLAPFALDARHLDGEVVDVLAAQKDGSTRKVEVHTLPEMKRTALVYSFGHHNHTSPIGCCAVDELLDGLGLHLIRRTDDAIVVQPVCRTKIRQHGGYRIEEPRFDNRSIGETLLCALLGDRDGGSKK